MSKFISMSVISDQYEPGAGQISIELAHLDRVEGAEIDIMIKFEKPNEISPSMTSPDDLKLTVIRSSAFYGLKE